MDIKAVIFDFGGVFTTSPILHFERFEQENGLPKLFLASVIKYNLNDGAFAQYERGEIDLERFDQLFAQETKNAGHEVGGKTLVELLNLSFYPAMETALDRLIENGFLTGCITNNFPKNEKDHLKDNRDYMQNFRRIYSKFDEVIESSQAGVRKPEARIYEMMTEKLKVTAQQCVFLDDLGVNVKAAQALGMQVIKVPFENIESAIDQLGQLLSLDLS